MLPIAAALQPPAPSPQLSSPPSVIYLLLEALFLIAVVCVVAWLAARFARRRRTTLPGSARVLSRTELDQKRAIVVVEVAGKCLLLGVADGGVTLISELDGEKIKAEVDLVPERTALDFLRSAKSKAQRARAS